MKGARTAVLVVAATLAAPSGSFSGRRLAYALMVNDVGAIEDIESGVADVFEDEAQIANVVYEEVR